MSCGRCDDLGGLPKKSLQVTYFVNLCDTENSIESQG